MIFLHNRNIRTAFSVAYISSEDDESIIHKSAFLEGVCDVPYSLVQRRNHT